MNNLTQSIENCAVNADSPPGMMKLLFSSVGTMQCSFASGYQTKKVFLIVYLRKLNGNTLAAPEQKRLSIPGTRYRNRS